jgi:hypothetical protein
VAKCPNCSLFQSILFYIPRWLWKNWEAGIRYLSGQMPQLFSVSVHPVLHPAMAVEELGGGHQILKWPNSPTVLCFSPSCSTSRDGRGRTGRQASALKVAKIPSLFSVSVHPVLHPAMAVEELGGRHQIVKWSKFLNCFSVSVHPVLHPAMAVEELGGRHQIVKWSNSPTVLRFSGRTGSIRHQILKWPNSLTVLGFSPSCSTSRFGCGRTSRNGCGRTGRHASDLKVAKFLNCFLFQSILFYI